MDSDGEAENVDEVEEEESEDKQSSDAESSETGKRETDRNREREHQAEEQGVSEAAAALEAVIHSAAQVAQEGLRASNGLESRPLSAEVAFEAQKADLIRQRACVAYLLEMQRFADCVKTGIEDIRNMLHSKTITDVLEAIDFFLTAKQAGVRGLDAALRHLMAMIWSQEEQIRKAVLDACRYIRQFQISSIDDVLFIEYPFHLPL